MPEGHPEKPDRRTARDKRRSEALRANLKRRKAQLRGRAHQVHNDSQSGTDAENDET
jgi:hypothetical protein